LAVAFVEPSVERFRYQAIANTLFVKKQEVKALGIGPGSKAMLVGRFVNHEGKQKNLPCVRCGTIAIMADEGEKVRISEKPERLQEAFLVELHTKCGYSGSPVFFQGGSFHAGQSHMPVLTPEGEPLFEAGPRLLGVHIGQIRDTAGNQVRTENIDTGMAIVIPAWRLTALLGEQRFREKMRTADQDFADKEARSPVKLESVTDQPSQGTRRRRR
jgi:hypothetical protein